MQSVIHVYMYNIKVIKLGMARYGPSSYMHFRLHTTIRVDVAYQIAAKSKTAGTAIKAFIVP